MRYSATRRRSAGPADSTEMPRFPTPWIVKAEPPAAALHVEIPALKLQERVVKLKEKGAQADADPKFLRLDMRRPGLRGKLALRPVLKADPKPGVSHDWLTVPASLMPSIPSPPNTVDVTSAPIKAFRWYRFRRSAGSLFGTVASIISGLLLTLAAAGFGSAVSLGLLIAGGVLAILAAAAALVSAWRTPVE
jgi:hypothetical protein